MSVDSAPSVHPTALAEDQRLYKHVHSPFGADRFGQLAGAGHALLRYAALPRRSDDRRRRLNRAQRVRGQLPMGPVSSVIAAGLTVLPGRATLQTAGVHLATSLRLSSSPSCRE